MDQAGESWTGSRPGAWIELELGRSEVSGVPSRVADLVPPSFDAYARVFHPVVLEGREWTWAELAQRRDKDLTPVTQLPELLAYKARPNGSVEYEGKWSYRLYENQWNDLGPVLKRHTTSDSFLIAVWEGNGALPPHERTEPLLLPHGRYHCLRIPFETWSTTASPHNFAPGLVWPDDQAWCMGGWLDASSTYIGGPSALIRDVLELGSVEAAPARLDDPVVFI